MAHEFGGIVLPVAVPEDGEALADPALDVLGGYLSAVLISWAGTAWLSRAAGEPIVRTVQLCDPSEAEFIERELPALYVWRAEVDTEYVAEEVTGNKSKIQLMWVPPPKTTQVVWAQRSAIINAVAKVITAALDLDRHPAWVRAGDTDTAAATLGSVWMRWAGVSMAYVGKTTRSVIAVATEAGKRLRYPCVMVDLHTEEFLTWDPSDFADAVAPSLDLQIDTPDLATVLQHTTIPAP